MDVFERHTVTFYSPGTVFDEESTRVVVSWDVAAALRLMATIEERHGARPYSFRFSTALAAAPIDDGRGGKLEVRPRELRRSGLHYVDAEVLDLAAVEREQGRDSILYVNMVSGGWAKVAVTRRGWKHTGPLSPGDKLVDSRTGEVRDP